MQYFLFHSLVYLSINLSIYLLYGPYLRLQFSFQSFTYYA